MKKNLLRGAAFLALAGLITWALFRWNLSRDTYFYVRYALGMLLLLLNVFSPLVLRVGADVQYRFAMGSCLAAHDLLFFLLALLPLAPGLGYRLFAANFVVFCLAQALLCATGQIYRRKAQKQTR